MISEGIAGNIVCKKGELPLYYKVMLPDGRTAYVSKSDAEDMDKWLATRRLTAENLIFAARQFSGIPYVWGGTSVKEMDCSGFIKTVFYLNGAIIPRDASQQAECGKDIDITKGLFDLRPGDLLFFGKKGTAGQKDRISHVGMYIGDNRFIHASTYVRTNSLMEGDSDYYVNTPNLVRVRRFIGCQDNGSGITSISAHPMYAK